MLHNSGPYGPNDTPINMGTPVNMTQMNSPLNIGHNLSNLGKMVQQPPHTMNSSYNLPDYPTYGHPPLSIPSQVNPFPNYNQVGFQPNYLVQNPTSIHDTSWQNGMLPMNLNMQPSHGPNMNDYPLPYEKRPPNLSDDLEQPYRNNIPINIPQVPTKAFQKLDEHSRYDLYNVNQDKFNHFNHHLSLSNTQDRPLLDNTRRKSLENTVRLIEDILINTTRNKDLQRQQENMLKKASEKKHTAHKDIPKRSEQNDTSLDRQTVKLQSKALTKDTEANIHDENKIDMDEDEENKVDVHEGDEEDVDFKSKENQSNKNECTDKIDEDTKSMDNFVMESDESSSSEDEITNNDNQSKTDKEEPLELIKIKVEVEQESEPEVVVKIEQMGWTDSDYVSPFQRDTSGIIKDDLQDSDIIDCETSVADAIAIVKSGATSNNSFECPHCNLIIKHPKRFLIHTKWHSFGLTNEKRMELAKEKELRRNQRKEARVIDRMNSKEVKETIDGKKVFSCKDCSKAFSSKGSLKNHRQRHHPTRVRDCKICGKTVLGWMAHRAHLATHNNDSGYQCPECPKKFKYSHSLTKHRDTHLEKTLGCEQCDKMFGSQQQLKMHQKVHERAQRGTTFRCSYCAKGFYEAYNLAVHERTHRNERPFLCDICNTSFGTNSSLKRHLKVSHSTSKPFECSTCHRSFVTESIRDRHEMRQHGDPEDFKFTCKQCDCRYLKLKDLQKHVYKAHPKGKRKKREKSDSE